MHTACRTKHISPQYWSGLPHCPALQAHHTLLLLQLPLLRSSLPLWGETAEKHRRDAGFAAHCSLGARTGG